MKKVFLFIVVILVFTVMLQGQYWIRSYGGNDWDFGHSVQITNDSCYILTGRTMSFGAGGEDLYIVKIDTNGDTIWTKTYGGIDSDGGCCIQKTSDGGYIIVGRTISFGAGYLDVWLLKTDSLGDTLWTRTFGTAVEEWGYYVEQTTDDGYIITGYRMYSPGEGDVWLIKTDDLGNEQWQEVFGGPNYDEARSVRQTPDGGYIICGTDNFNIANSELYLIKTDSLGNEDWSKRYGGPLMDYGLGVTVTSDSGYIITGKKNISGVAGEVYVLRTDTQGDTLWTRTYGAPADDYGHSVEQTNDGGFVVVGAITNTQTYYSNGCIIRLNAQGDSLWTRVYGDTNYANFFSVQQVSDSGYICVGSVYENDYNIYAVRTGKDGHVRIAEEKEERKEKPRFNIIAFPNPFVSYTVVDGRENEKFSIYDVQGRFVGKCKGNRIGAELNPGIYYLKSEIGSSTPLRVVKIK